MYSIYIVVLRKAGDAPGQKTVAVVFACKFLFVFVVVAVVVAVVGSHLVT